MYHYPAGLASSTFQIRIPLHGAIRQEKALCGDGRVESDRARLGMAGHNQVLPACYMASTYRFRRQREAGTELNFFRLVDSTVVLPNIETTPRNTEASDRPQASGSSASSR